MSQIKNKKVVSICILIALLATTITTAITIQPVSGYIEDFTITLKSGSTTINLTPADIYAMPSYTGVGALRSSGTIQSGGNYTGVPIKYLINLMGGMTSSSTLYVRAPDGFYASYTYSEIYNDDLVMHDPATNTQYSPKPTDTTLLFAYQWAEHPGADFYNSPRILLVRPLENYPASVAILGNQCPKNVTYIEITNPPTNPITFKTSDISGTAKSTYNMGENVYFTATALSASTTYPVYVVPDVATWTFHTALPDRVSDAATSVTTDSSGNITPTSIYSNALPGKYDIVIDINSNGQFDENDLLINNVVTSAGVFVLPEYSFGALLAISACFIAFVAYAALKNGAGLSYIRARKL